MTLTLRISEQDSQLIRDYAQMKGMTVSEFMRRAALEKIEDEIDLQAALRARAEYQADPKTVTLDEVEKELGLQ